MRLGDDDRAADRGHPHRVDRARRRARHRRPAARPGRRDLRPGVLAVRPRSRCTRWPTPSAAGGIAAFIDAEHALDPDYAKKLGVDTDALLVSQPDTGEQALEIADMLIRSGALDIIVIDSVAALVPRAEIEGEMGDSHVGLQARLMSQALRKITGALNNSGTTAIFINQLREKIGVMFGSPETTTGGKALKFYASVRLDVRRIETLKDGTDAVGNRTRVKVVKNKVAPPFKQAEFDIIYGKGISREGGLIDVGVEQGFVRKAGAWYTYEGDQLGQGKENARNFLQGQPRPRRRDREEDQGEARHRGAAARGRGRARDLGRLLSPPGLTAMPFADSTTPPPAWAVGSGGGVADGGPRRRTRSRRAGRPAAAGPRGPTRATRGSEPDPHDCGPPDPARQLTAGAAQPPQLSRQAAPARTAPTTSPPRCSTGWRRSAWSTTRPSPACWCAPAGRPGPGPPGPGPGAAPQGHRRRDRRRRRSTRSTRTTRRTGPARWSRRSCARCSGLDADGADPPAGRDARPQGLPVRPVVRASCARRSREAPEHQRD